MAAMKVTISAAMRARDVSRPRPEDLAEAEASEAIWAGETGGPRADGSGVADGPDAAGGAGVADGAGVAGGWGAAAEGADTVADGVDTVAGIGPAGRSQGRPGRRHAPRRRRRGSGGGRPSG